jgi:hypothetical protein
MQWIILLPKKICSMEINEKNNLLCQIRPIPTSQQFARHPGSGQPLWPKVFLTQSKELDGETWCSETWFQYLVW